MTNCMIGESRELLSKSSITKYWNTSLTTSPHSLERIVREASANQEHEKIAKVIDQLCRDFAYAVHQPHARNGGLIGLAAASIALGSVCIEEQSTFGLILTDWIGRRKSQDT